MKVEFVTPKPNLAKTIDQWLTPAFPTWFKEIKVPIEEAIRENHKTVRHCPAFVHLFKNSHLLRAPQDMSLFRDEDGRIASREPNAREQFFSGEFNFEFQMGKQWSKYDSIKFDVRGSLIPEESTTCLFFDPIYHEDEKTTLTAMTGVWPMHPELYSHIGINMLGNRQCFDDAGFLHIFKGTPLAYLYWPQGKPTIATKVVSEEEYERDYGYVHNNFVGDFIKKEKDIVGQ